MKLRAPRILPALLLIVMSAPATAPAMAMLAPPLPNAAAPQDGAIIIGTTGRLHKSSPQSS